MPRDVYLLPVDHDPFKPGIQGEDEEARAYADRPALPATSSSLAHYRAGIGSDRVADRERPYVLAQTVAKDISDFVYSPHLSPEYKKRFVDEVINKPFTGAGLPGVLAGTYEAGKGMVEGGINSILNWTGATRGHPEVVGNPKLVAPRGTEDYQEGPISDQAMLAPVGPGLGAFGAGLEAALGRETLRGGAKVGRMIQGAVENASRSEKVTPASQQGIRAYHGTPYSPEKFGEFDTTKARDGVIYFSGDQGVAQDMLTRSALGKKPSRGERGQGHVIEAHLNVHPDRLFDMDAPLSSQSTSVKEALKPLLDKMQARNPSEPLPDVPGHVFLGWIKNDYGKAPGDVLTPLGVPGFRSAYNGAPEYGIWDKSVISRGRGDRASGAANASDSLKRISNPIKVFHGSPHDFDKFDSKHIGSGEGAQAFGHGLYFAENRKVAEKYQERDFWDENSTNPWNEGRLYEVSLHATPDQFLDWDLPLSKQSEGVRKAFLEAYERASAGAGRRIPLSERARMEDHVNTLALALGSKDRSVGLGLGNPDHAGASSVLRELGITGIRYKDQGSRGKEGGTYNYVVFPGADDVIEIIGKDGKPLQGAEKAKAVKELYARQDRGGIVGAAANALDQGRGVNAARPEIVTPAERLASIFLEGARGNVDDAIKNLRVSAVDDGDQAIAFLEARRRQSAAGREVGGAAESPERPYRAATKIGDEIFEGLNHGDSYLRAVDKLGEHASVELDAGRHVEGFITDRGRFVTRPEATELMKAFGAKAHVRPGHIDSSEVNRANGVENGKLSPLQIRKTGAPYPELPEIQRPGDRSNGAANASESLNPKAVKELYARQGSPVPGEDEPKNDEPRRIYLVPVDHNPFAARKTAAAISPGDRPGPAGDVYLGETPADTQQRQYNEHLKRLFEADAAAPYGPDALMPDMGGAHAGY